MRIQSENSPQGELLEEDSKAEVDKSGKKMLIVVIPSGRRCSLRQSFGGASEFPTPPSGQVYKSEQVTM